MTTIIAPFLASLVTLIVMDLLWLGFIMRSFYQTQLAQLLAPTPNWYAAGLFYLLYTAGVMYFAVLPNAAKGLSTVALQAALLGLFAYGVYDLTNHATLKNWPLIVTLVDMAWGAFITALVASVGYATYTYFGR